MNRLTKNTIQLIFGAIAAVAGIVAILTWFQIKPFNEKEVTAESVVYKLFNLTNKSDSLIVQYKGKSIDNLWKIRFAVRNTGKKSIIGIGESSDIYKNCINFRLEEGFEVISYNIVNDDFSDSLYLVNNSFSCFFRKWKTGESLQLDIWVQSHSTNNSPLLFLDERSMINPVIENKNKVITELDTSEDGLDWLINLKLKYPKIFFSIAKYIGLLLGAFGILVMFVSFIEVPASIFRYRKWKKKHMRTFLKELEGCEIDPNLKEKLKKRPYDTPNVIRHKFSSLPPQFVYEGWSSFIMPFFLVLVGFTSVIFMLFAWNNL